MTVDDVLNKRRRKKMTLPSEIYSACDITIHIISFFWGGGGHGGKSEGS